MTKQYIAFENFKRIILEADNPNKPVDNNTDKNIYWQGGIFWGIKFSPIYTNSSDITNIEDDSYEDVEGESIGEGKSSSRVTKDKLKQIQQKTDELKKEYEVFKQKYDKEKADLDKQKSDLDKQKAAQDKKANALKAKELNKRKEQLNKQLKIQKGLNGTFYCYIGILNDKLLNEQIKMTQTFMTQTMKPALNDSSINMTGDSSSFTKFEPVKTAYKNSDKYKLYESNGKFTILLDDIPQLPDLNDPEFNTKFKALKEKAEELRQKLDSNKSSVNSKFNKLVSDFVKANGLYAQAPLSISNNDGKIFDSCVGWIEKLVNQPSSFGGYNQMLGNKKKIANTGWKEYLNQADTSATGFLGAILTKAALGGHKTKLNKEKPEDNKNANQNSGNGNEQQSTEVSSTTN